MPAKRIALLTLGLLATICFVALGLWQVQRRSWKLDLIARVDSRIHAPAVPTPERGEWPAVNERDDAYRHVSARGVLLHSCETLVQAMTELGAGFWVMTPLRTERGNILVNRGFVPPERRDAKTRQTGQLEGIVTVTGLMRMTEPKGGFLRSNDPEAGRWYSRDVDAIASACGLTEAAPFFIDADSASGSGSFPIGGMTVVAFRNSHLVYAIIWFMLAVMSAVGMIILFRSRFIR